jgi:TPR repeat protein
MRFPIAILLAALSFSAAAQETVREPAAIAVEADRYARGDGVVQDDAQALVLYEEAAGLGNGYAMFRLGEMYAAGRGVEADDAMAVEYFRTAVAASYVPAMTSLGICYAEGRGVAADLIVAQALLEQAADAGDKRAKEYLVRYRMKP